MVPQMRWFSRLHSWLRAADGTRSSEAALELNLDSGPVPNVPADLFRRRLLRSVRMADQQGQIIVADLDPTIRMMVLPSQDDSSNSGSLGPEIDQAIRSLESTGRVLSSLTWSALRDARPTFSPNFHDWAGDLTHLFDGGIGIVFFIDLDGIVSGVGQIIQQYGYTAEYDEANDRLIARDGRFTAKIGMHALLAECLWTGNGPLSVIGRRGRGLPSEFRAFSAFEKGLRRRFPNATFDVDGDFIVATDENHEKSRIDYRHACACIRARTMTIENWLKRVVLWDLGNLSGDPHVQLKSPSYCKAYPDRMVQDHGSYALLLARQLEDGRTAPIPCSDDDPEERLFHYMDEARRQSAFIRYDAHAFVVEKEDSFAIGLVGDKIASVGLSPQWVAGVLEQLVDAEGEVSVFAGCEDALLITSVDIQPEPMEGAQRFLRVLMEDLYPDGSDELSFSDRIPIPKHPAGLFQLELVDVEYFKLRFAMEDRGAHSAARQDYLRAIALQALGRHDAARDSYEKSIRGDRSSGPTFLAYGKMLIELGDAERATSILKGATTRLPDNADAQNALGLACALLGDVQDASQAFEQAVRLEPSEPAFLINLGKSYSDGYQYYRAQACLERALNMEPDSAEAHAVMAVICLKTGDDGAARHHAREALMEAPDDASVRRLLTALESYDSPNEM